jgi:hypothetical protein
MSDVAIQTSGDQIELTKGGGVIPKTRAVYVATEGTMNFVNAAGRTVSNFPALAGVLPLQIVELLSGGTADDIWGLY